MPGWNSWIGDRPANQHAAGCGRRRGRTAGRFRRHGRVWGGQGTGHRHGRPDFEVIDADVRYAVSRSIRCVRSSPMKFPRAHRAGRVEMLRSTLIASGPRFDLPVPRFAFPASVDLGNENQVDLRQLVFSMAGGVHRYGVRLVWGPDPRAEPHHCASVAPPGSFPAAAGLALVRTDPCPLWPGFVGHQFRARPSTSTRPASAWTCVRSLRRRPVGLWDRSMPVCANIEPSRNRVIEGSSGDQAVECLGQAVGQHGRGT